jgi:tRNA uridine 5-carboxymethylaminomethyl modification enzyme
MVLSSLPTSAVEAPVSYDCIVVGAGHAGCEAALAAARMGCRTLVLTINLDTIARMPCNPSIGGPAKGHLVREVDALGGEMGRAADATHLHIRMLNTSKGPAVQALRAQADRNAYKDYMKGVLETQPNLDLMQDVVEAIVVDEAGCVRGVTTQTGWLYRCASLVITTGTFLNGLCHIGPVQFAAGRQGEPPAAALSDSLRSLGLELGRLKTGTPPRVNRRSIDFSKTVPQVPDGEPFSFSFDGREAPPARQMDCYLTHTTARTREIILANLHRSPIYDGTIDSRGPRYCPSIEDKIMRFADKETHQVFLEPEGFDTQEVYVQGMSTSLPLDVQVELIRSVVGLEQAEIMRPGYAVEYDFVHPTQLAHTLEVRKVPGLFLAGQINGTTGYEEAAAQGLLAGINAACRVLGRAPFILERARAYIGVLIDDLVTKGTLEPYRMMTSRAEFRLNLRHDNADDRLTPLGYELGLYNAERYARYLAKREQREAALAALATRRIKQADRERFARDLAHDVAAGLTAQDVLKRPQIGYGALREVLGDLPALERDDIARVEVCVKYDGYIERQKQLVAQFSRMEEALIPDHVDYAALTFMSSEAREKLARIRPRSLGQASRISGVSPADVSMLMIWMEQRRKQAGAVDEAARSGDIAPPSQEAPVGAC